MSILMSPVFLMQFTMTGSFLAESYSCQRRIRMQLLADTYMQNKSFAKESRLIAKQKSKQRYLDYVYKIGIKRKFEMMIHSGILIPSEVQNIHFYVDEHTTATDGRYELQESLEQEFRFGTNNWNYSRFFPPIFQHLQSLEVRFCNSSTTTLVRAADIVANKLYFRVQNDLLENRIDSNFLVTRLPHEYRWQI